MALQPPHFASRLVMAGMDLLTVQRLGGWRTLAMVQRYSHLAPDHLRAAVERLAVVQLGQNLDPTAETHRTLSGNDAILKAWRASLNW